MSLVPYWLKPVAWTGQLSNFLHHALDTPHTLAFMHAYTPALLHACTLTHLHAYTLARISAKASGMKGFRALSQKY